MMGVIPVNLAVEDRLSEAVLRRLMASANRGYAIGFAYNRGGYGYLKKSIRGWNSAAAGTPFVLLTDLNSQYPCPPALFNHWLPVRRHPNLLVHVAVVEVEAWLLADRLNIARFLAVREGDVPGNVEQIADPKAALVGLAQKSRRKAIRQRIVPRQGSTAKQGPDYNGCLIEFVSTAWDVEAASEESSSLRRAVARFKSFLPSWPQPSGARNSGSRE